MNVADVTLDVDGRRYPGRLHVPDARSGRGVSVIPGAGHGPFGDVFDRFAAAAADEGSYVASFETWEDRDDLTGTDDSDFEAELDARVEFLRSWGCSTVTVVAKSFGGRLALSYVPDDVDRMVLWAPAILFGDRADVPSITASELAGIEVPVRVLQGDEDEVVSVENAAKLVEHLPNGELVELPGEDHSFLNDERRVVERTLAFLPD